VFEQASNDVVSNESCSAGNQRNHHGAFREGDERPLAEVFRAIDTASSRSPVQWSIMPRQGCAQGLRIKMGVFQHVQQVVRVEGCFHPFGFGAVRDGLVLPQ
jgi:hypothetical protein